MEARRTLPSVTPEPSTRTTATPRRYAERLRVPWWSWPPSLLVGAVVAVEFSMFTTAVPVWVPFAVLLPLTVAVLWWLSRLRVAVTGAEFQVDDARLPVEVIADVVALDANGKREVLGVGAHPLAFVDRRGGTGAARRPGRPDAVLGGQHAPPGPAGDRPADR
jgi:hypothetical protein